MNPLKELAALIAEPPAIGRVIDVSGDAVTVSANAGPMVFKGVSGFAAGDCVVIKDGAIRKSARQNAPVFWV